MKKRMIRVLCFLMAMVLSMPLPAVITARAEETAYETVRVSPDTKDTGKEEYFSYTAYSGKSWTANANEAYIDLGTSDANAEQCWYEFHFTGTAVKIYATKGPTHGKARFTIDGGDAQTVDLYKSGTRGDSLVYEKSGLTDGPHVIKAVTLNEKSGSKVINQVKYAEVTKKAYVGPPDLGGTMCDTNMQYTKDRYAEIAAQNVTSAELSAWRGDKAAGEIVLYTKYCSLTNVRAEAGPLRKGNDTIGKENARAVFIKSAKAYNGPFLGYAVNKPAYPAETAGNRSETSDILYQEGGSVSMGYNSLQPIWVEYSIPKDAKAGEYTGTVTVTADGISEPLKFTYTVTVQDVVLPEADTYGDTFDIELWQYPYSSAEYYGVEPFSEAHFACMRSSMDKYKAIGGQAITATIIEEAWNGQTYSKNEIHYPSMVKWTKNSDGSFSYDYTDFDKWVGFLKDEIGLTGKIVLYSIAPWHTSFKYWEGTQLKTESFTAGNDRYNEVWGNFLRNLISHLEEKGWFDDAYIGIDERGLTQAGLDLIDSIKNTGGKSLKTSVALDSFVTKRDLAMRIHDLSIGDTAAYANAAAFATLLADRNAKGFKTTLYSCTEHKPGNFSLSIPAESYWSVVNAGKMGTAGFLRWAYDAWVEDPLRDTTHAGCEPGDCFLIFPDEKANKANAKSKSSVRLERMAEGIRDVNKLLYLKKQRPALASDITTLYGTIATTAATGQTYLTDAQKKQLAAEMTAFKEGVSLLTAKYVKETSGGLYVPYAAYEMNPGTAWQIPAELNTTAADKAIVYRSDDPAVASVDAAGRVTARRIGSTVIRLKNAASGYMTKVKINVTVPNLIIKNTLTDYKLPAQYLSDIEKDQDNVKGHRYLGQPDMIMLDDKQTLITVYPVGHGQGPMVMQVSRDAGATWQVKTNTPESWETSYETPTIYKLNLTNGDTKLIVISGRPKSFNAPTGGWDTSISDNDGETWTEFKTWHENLPGGARNETVVAMASMIQLKDKDGNLIDKWLAVYHDGGTFENFKTYLTFDENGNEQWSAPERYLAKHRAIEQSHQICEVGMSRSPDGKRIFALARNQSHNGPSTMFYSDDEGETWSEPTALPGSLAGERHKIMYDPTDPSGQRMIVTFREIQYDKNNNNTFDGGSDWMAGDWIAWVGTYDDIMNRTDGLYRILLCEDWTQNTYSGDTGYSGLAVLDDGTFIIDSYGHWDRAYSENHKATWPSGTNYNTREDLCYIKQAKFKLSDLDAVVGSGGTKNLKTLAEENLQEESAILNPENEDSDKYTEESWTAYTKAYTEAQTALSSQTSTSSSLQALAYALRQARLSLVMAEADQLIPPPVDPDVPDDPEDPPKNPTPESPQGPKPDTPTPEKPGPTGDSQNPGTTGKPDTPGTPDASNALKAGDSADIKGIRYTVLDPAAKTADAKGIDKKKLSSAVIASEVTINGVVCKVTAVAPNAFKSFAKLKKVTIGANVTAIGKSAFTGCKALGTVTFDRTKLTSVAKNCFKGTKPGLKLKYKGIAAADKKALLKALAKSGINKKMLK